MSDSRVHVGFVGGLDVASNVRTLLENLRRLLRSRPTEFDCDLLVSTDEPLPAGYRGVRIDSPPVNTARERISVLRRAIRRYANRESPDVLVQLTRFPTHGTAVAIAGKSTGTPTITRLAGDNFREYNFANSFGERVRTYALKNVIAHAAVHLPDAVVTLGPNGHRDLSVRLRNRNVWTIPQPVDGEQFFPVDRDERERIRASVGMPALGDRRVLLTVGRVSRRKGAETVERTASSLPKDVEWFVVGDGPLVSKLSELERVQTVGRVPHDRMAEYYQAADLYIHPSLHEGLPNVLLEATACGTPSIARDVGECESVATATFSDDSELVDLAQRTYDRIDLPEEFEDDRLAEKYESLLVEVAT